MGILPKFIATSGAIKILYPIILFLYVFVLLKDINDERCISLKEVSCKALLVFFKDMEKNNHPLEILCEGLPYDLNYLRNGSENIEWDVFCKLMYNTRKIWNDEDYIRLGKQIAHWRTFPVLSALLGLFLNVKEVYILTSSPKKGAGPQHFRCVRSEVREIDNKQLEIKLELPPGYKYSREFFLITKGFYIEAPVLVKLKPSNVIMQKTDRGAIYNVYYPQSHNIFSWIKNISTSILYKRVAIEELSKSYELLYERYYQLEESRTKIQKQAKLLETANSISQFISSDLDLNFTLKTLAKVLIDVAGFAAVEVTVDSTMEGEQIKSFVDLGSKPKGVTPIQRNLEAHGHKIGEIFLWSNTDANLNENHHLLDLIIPTISIDTLNAISYKLVNDYRDKLELKVADRTIQLNDANQELASVIDKLKGMQIARDRFFTGISHEFRTPLTLIIGPSDRILEESADNNIKKQAHTIRQNAIRILGLIQQLLELSKLESSAISVKAKKHDLVTVLRGLLFAFESLAKEKNINLSFSCVEQSIITWFDKDKLEKIINNLLSNAFKFTHDTGSILISVDKMSADENEFAYIKITDTGIGIPSSDLEKIFDRFYQVDDSVQRAYGSSGIGLALVREFVDLHKWNISVTSTEGKGTEFHLKIPLWEDYLDESQKVKSDSEDIGIRNYIPIQKQLDNGYLNELEPSDDISEEKTVLNVRSEILIIEDSTDVRDYIYDLLKSDYTIYHASNGAEGLNTAQEKMPDLIISDVMMPVMDGMEFCRRIKTEFLTCHIPVILLTAKASPESKIEGLETGADSYLTKPFNSKELLVRIKNLLDQRKLLKEKFSKDINLKPDKVTTNRFDDEFLRNVFASVEKNLANEKYDSDVLAKDVFMSRMKLHRKLQAVTGQAPGEFIRAYKLKRAAQMLLEKNLSVTQIAFEVGYNSPSHFSKAFIKCFNCSPSDYAK